MAENINILFSSTQGWNPGDEFILKGTKNILSTLNVRFNSFLYNRHPDLRSQSVNPPLFKNIVLNDYNVISDNFLHLNSNIKISSFDNSFKSTNNSKIIDLAVVAGTPEWNNGKMLEFYNHCIIGRIPLLIIGVGGGYSIHNNFIHDVTSVRL